jgi:hypothetical protein
LCCSFTRMPTLHTRSLIWLLMHASVCSRASLASIYHHCCYCSRCPCVFLVSVLLTVVFVHVRVYARSVYSTDTHSSLMHSYTNMNTLTTDCYSQKLEALTQTPTHKHTHTEKHTMSMVGEGCCLSNDVCVRACCTRLRANRNHSHSHSPHRACCYVSVCCSVLRRIVSQAPC